MSNRLLLQAISAGTIKWLVIVHLLLLLFLSTSNTQSTLSPIDSGRVPDSLSATVDNASLVYVLSEEVVYEAEDSDQQCFLAEASQDGRVAAVVILEANKQYLYWHGTRSKGYDLINSVYVSPSGRSCGFYATKGKDYYAVVDGEQFGKYSEFADSITFSPNDSQYFFAAVKKGHFADWAVSVLNGEEEKHDNILTTEPRYFSPDGARSAFFIRDGKKCRAVVDGKKGPKYDLTGLGPSWSADGSTLAYTGSRNDTVYLVVNGEERGGHTSINSLAFSPDGSELAYGALENYDHFMFRDSDKYGPYQKIWHPTYASDASHFAFVAMRDTMIFVVSDGVEHSTHRDVTWPVYSPSGDRLSYVIHQGSVEEGLKQAVWVDGVTDPEYDYVYANTLVFSQDGEHFAYVAEIDTLRVVAVIDGMVGKEYRMIYDLGIHNLGNFYRAQVSDSAWCLVINGKESQRFQQVWKPLLSPDSNHIACFIASNNRLRLWIDGRLYGDYARVRPDVPWFSKAGEIRFCAAADDRAVLSVTVALE